MLEYGQGTIKTTDVWLWLRKEIRNLAIELLLSVFFTVEVVDLVRPGFDGSTYLSLEFYQIFSGPFVRYCNSEENL